MSSFTQIFMQSNHFSCQILMKLNVLGSFEKSSNIMFHENLSNGSRVVPCARTEGRDKTNSRFLQFCNRPKIAICNAKAVA